MREVKYWSRIYGLNRGLYSHLTKIKMVFNIAPFDPMRFHIRTGFNEDGVILTVYVDDIAHTVLYGPRKEKKKKKNRDILTR